MINIFLSKKKSLFFISGAIIISFPMLIGSISTSLGATVKDTLYLSGSTPSAFPSNIAPSSEVERGRELFMGNKHLQNGGPPCMTCHNIGNVSLLGGGTLGPDLTDISQKYSDSGLAEFLGDIPSPVMKPIYSTHPLTSQEQADLRAFLMSSTGPPSKNKAPWLISLSMAGLAGVVGLFGFLYRNRFRGMRRTLVKKVR